MAFEDYIPFYQSPSRLRSQKKRAQVIDDQADKTVAKLFKVVSLALGFTGTADFGSRTSFESPPYDLDRVIQAVDTDSFVKQAFNKYKELLWKEGWDIIGENDVSVDYLHERIDYMEYAMRRPFQDLLNDIGDQLVKYGNCFLAKSRGDLSPSFQQH